MKYLVVFLTIVVFNMTIAQSNEDIINWLNNFEDRNSPERIMKGTFEDKVNLDYKDGELIVNSMVYRGSSTPAMKTRTIIKVSEITQIEALKTVKDNFTIYDINICANPGAIDILIKDANNNFKSATWANKYFEQKGYCTSEYRLKFSINSAKEEIERVYNAFRKLSENHGINPKIGSLF